MLALDCTARGDSARDATWRLFTLAVNLVALLVLFVPAPEVVPEVVAAELPPPVLLLPEALPGEPPAAVSGGLPMADPGAVVAAVLLEVPAGVPGELVLGTALLLLVELPAEGVPPVTLGPLPLLLPEEVGLLEPLPLLLPEAVGLLGLGTVTLLLACTAEGLSGRG